MTDEEYDVYLEKLNKISEFYGIKTAHWACEEPVDLDFSKKFSEKTLTFKNQRQGGKTFTLVAPTYADIWKAFDESLKRPTDHVFIEDLIIDGTELKIHTGS